jgi:hypothetical protein
MRRYCACSMRSHSHNLQYKRALTFIIVLISVFPQISENTDHHSRQRHISHDESFPRAGSRFLLLVVGYDGSKTKTLSVFCTFSS